MKRFVSLLAKRIVLVGRIRDQYSSKSWKDVNYVGFPMNDDPPE